MGFWRTKMQRITGREMAKKEAMMVGVVVGQLAPASKPKDY
jgi:hypothetical protein